MKKVARFVLPGETSFGFPRIAVPEVPRTATAVCLCAIIIVPLALFLRPNAHLGGDYESSYWMTGYFAQYMRLHHHPPNVFQTSVSLGIAFPLFYGVLFYRLTGLVSAFSNTDDGLRVVITIIVSAEILTVYRAARALQAGRLMALFASASVACSTYALTNLYNRGDLPEFAAVALLTTAIATWFWSLRAVHPLERWLCRAIIAACMTLVCGTHVITLALGAAMFFGSAALTLCFDRVRSTYITFAVAAAAFLAGAAIPLVEYVIVGHQFRFAPGIYAYGFGMMTDRIDSGAARFSLFPLDPQSLIQGIVNVSTPYLEAPIDYGLLLFAAAVLLFRRSAAAIVFAIAALAVAVVSVWPWFWAVVPPPLHFFQFTYRLTSYADLLSLCAFFAVLWSLPEQSRRVAETPVPWVGLTLVFVSLAVKLSHACVVLTDVPNSESSIAYINIGPQFGASHTNYTTIPQMGDASPPHAAVPAVSFSAVGAPLPQRYQADRNGFVFTRILVFPWNGIIVDGKRLPAAQKLAWHDSSYYGFRTTPRSTHDVQTSFDLPPVVDRAIRLAEYSFIVECIAIVGLLVTAGMQRYGRPLRHRDEVVV